MNYQCTVYCLFRPNETRAFYFGITSNPKAREWRHRRNHGRETRFIALHVLGCALKAGAWERHYIRMYEALGWPLLNKQKTVAHEAGMTERRRNRRKT